MPGIFVPQGPWGEGLALDAFVKAPYSASPASLRFINNLDVTDQGTLQARPGLRRCGTAAMYSGTTSFTLLGTIDGDAAATTAALAVVAAAQGGGVNLYYTYTPFSTSAWDLVPGGSVTGPFSTIVKYNSVLYIMPLAAGNGLSRTSLNAGSYTSVPTIPIGRFASVVRERMFTFDTTANRMYWSKATDPTIWAAPDGGFTDINPGDGQVITSVVVVNSQIYIFKEKKTYLFTFSSDPATDGQVTLISGTEGAFAATTFNNTIYGVNRRGVFRLQNTITTPLSLSQSFDLNLGLALNSASSINVEGNYLVVGPLFPSTGVTQTYSHAAMNLNTGAWSLRSYQTGAGAFPTPFVEFLAPRGYAITWRDPSTTLALAAQAGAGNIYLSGGVGSALCYARTVFPVAGDSLDYDISSHQVSPQYDLITHAYSAGQYDAWKRLHHVYAHLGASLPVGDNVLSFSTYPAPALTVSQTATVPAVGGRVPIRSFRFRATAFGLSKAIKDLGAGVDPRVPTNSSTLYVYDLEPHISSHGRVVNTS